MARQHYTKMTGAVDIKTCHSLSLTNKRGQRQKSHYSVRKPANITHHMRRAIKIKCSWLSEVAPFSLSQTKRTTTKTKRKLPAAVFQRNVQAGATLGDVVLESNQSLAVTFTLSTAQQIRSSGPGNIAYTKVCIHSVTFTQDCLQCCKVKINRACQDGNSLMFH